MGTILNGVSDTEGDAKSLEEVDKVHIIGSFPIGSEELQWEERAETESFNALPNVRATAAAWELRLTALFGLLGGVALLGGRSSIQALGTYAAVLVGVLCAAALLGALTSIMFAALAAQGTPAKVYITGPELRKFYGQQLEEAARRLSISRRAAVFSVLILAAAIAITWYGSPNVSSQRRNNYLVLTTDDRVLCGRLDSLKDGEMRLRLVRGMSQEAKIALAQVQTIVPTPDCPAS